MNKNVKQRILLDAAQLILSHGAKAMTMDELAKRMGVSKRTIYEYFGDKDTLLIAIFQYHKKKGMADFKKILKESPTIIHAFSYWYINVGDASFAKLIALHDEIKRYHPVVFQKELRQNITQEFENLQYILLKGVKQGVLRKDLDVGVSALLVLSFFNQLKDENGIRQYAPAEKLHMEAMRIFMRGFCSEKGLQLVKDIQKTIKKQEKTPNGFIDL